MKSKLILFLAILLTPLMAWADTEAPPRSYTVPSSDGRFLFVMIAPLEVERDGASLKEEYRNEIKRIRAKYSISGLYLNDGSTTPLWTVDWYSHGVVVGSDGTHVVRLGPWARTLSDEAFTFFEDGKVIQSYKISDLVDTVAFLEPTTSHFFWIKDLNLDDQRQTFSVTTISKEQYAFDFTTGKIVSARRPLRAILVAIGAAFIFIVVSVFTLIRKRSRRAAEQIVGPERRGRVSHRDWSGRCLIEFAPPRQLNRWADETHVVHTDSKPR
jgi:hypothetical protein